MSLDLATSGITCPVEAISDIPDTPVHTRESSTERTDHTLTLILAQQAQIPDNYSISLLNSLSKSKYTKLVSTGLRTIEVPPPFSVESARHT